MENVHDTNFIVYIRQDTGRPGNPCHSERPLKTCATYAEARAIQREYLRAHQEVVIRFDGITGGGD